jgi:ABC-type branched-subunit amino acid transport system substrate-binding protein
VIKDVIMVTDYFWNIQTAKNRDFLEKYFKKYGREKRPSMRHYLHYISVMMWADAVRKVGTVDPKAIAAALPGSRADYGMGEQWIRTTGDHTTVKPIVVARGKGPKEMKDKFDTQEIVKLYTGEKYFLSAKEKGW